MIFIWGKKVRVKKLGYVGDFCPICRDLRVFKLQEVRIVSHLYHVPLGAGESAGHEIECADCGIALRAKLDDYASVSHDASAGAQSLAASVAPALAAQIKKRMELESKARLRRLGAEERAALLLEPFQLVSPKLEARLSRTHLDGASVAALAAAFAAPILLFWAGGLLKDPLASALDWTGIASLLASLAAALYLIATDDRRFLRRRLEPLLVRSLAPLAPSLPELASCVETMKAQGKVVGKNAEARRIYDAIEAAVKGPLQPS